MGEPAAGAPDAITLLGGFVVRVDGATVAASHWRRRPAANVVKLLALSPERRGHREEIIDALWPDSTVQEAAPRLHKAMHYARRALGGAGSLVSAGDSIQLLPDREVVVDLAVFERAAAIALDRGGADPASALDAYGGELLPDDRFEQWTEPRRGHVEHLRRQLLRAAGRWAELVAVEPTDEAAHVALMRACIERGDRSGALAQFDRLAAILESELAVAPGRDACEVRAAAEAMTRPQMRTELSHQRIQFCHGPDGLSLAYAVTGDGPPLVKAANWLSHLEYDWDSMVWRHWLRELSARFRLLRYDERGCGMSDRRTTEFSLDAWVEDLATVVDAAGYDRFPLLGVSQGSAVAVEYATRHPERVSALVIYGGYVHGPVARARTDEERRVAEVLPHLAELGWGTDEPSFRQVFTSRFMPGGSRAQWDEFNELERRTTTPSNAAAFMRAFAMIDVTEAAQRVQCPALVVHVRGDRMPPLREGRLLASLLPRGQFVSLEGDNHILLEDEPAWPRFLAEMDRFLRVHA